MPLQHHAVCLTLAALAVVWGAALTAPARSDGVTYYVSHGGSDDNDGRSPETSWRTLAKVNAYPIQPGDSVLLKRGDSWREQLIPHSGSEDGYVTYGAYGEGDKPVLLGSVELNDPDDWVEVSDGVWSTREPSVVGQEALPNPSFTDGTDTWSLYCENGAQAEMSRIEGGADTAPACLLVHGATPGARGSDVQLITAPFAIEQGRLYRLTFRCRSTPEFPLPVPTLMSMGPPWTNYSSGSGARAARVGAEWTTVVAYYDANTTSDTARFTLFLGDRLPAGADLFVDTFSFAACEGREGLLPVDVGNIIFDTGRSCGVKVFDESQLRVQDQFYYDEMRNTLKVRSDGPPTDRHADIECALRRHIIDESGKSYVRYENLALLYGGAHGISGGDTHHIAVRDCDLGFIGGGDQMGGDQTVRFGNGIEFWAGAHDNLVERCRLWEIYDAALTNQSLGAPCVQRNIVYRSNIIWNCEYSFEYWNRPEASLTENIVFEHNTCVDAGHGWGHTQRPDPSGRHLCFYDTSARMEGLTMRNNVFCEARSNAFFAPGYTKEQRLALVMDGNLWAQAEGNMILFADARYSQPEFARYQAEQGLEPHSLVGDPLFVDPAGRDFHLSPGSPCIDAAVSADRASDFDGTPVPQGAAPDIGALELIVARR